MHSATLPYARAASLRRPADPVRNDIGIARLLLRGPFVNQKGKSATRCARECCANVSRTGDGFRRARRRYAPNLWHFLPFSDANRKRIARGIVRDAIRCRARIQIHERVRANSDLARVRERVYW